MKHLLLLLLFCSVCTAQQQYKDYTKVTALRLVNSDEWGPCSIEHYAKTLKRTGHYIQAMESYNDTLAYNLLQLKEEAKTWPKDTCSCGEQPTGKPLIHNMFVVEVNSYKDTVYTTKGNTALFSPTEQQQYIDPENRIMAAFTKDVSDFLQRDFASEIAAWKMDIIPAAAIISKKKPFYGLTRKQFEKEFGAFPTVRTDSLSAPNGMLYSIVKTHIIDDASFSFDSAGGELSRVVINKPLSNNAQTNNFLIDGVKVGDPEEVLSSKYPNSTSLKNWDAPLSAINNYYTYELQLENKQGTVMFIVRNKVIHAIVIDFRYPQRDAKENNKKQQP